MPNREKGQKVSGLGSTRSIAISIALFLISPLLLYGLLKFTGPRPALIFVTVLIGRRFVVTFFRRNKELNRFLALQLVLLLVFLGLSLYFNHPLTVKILPAFFSLFLFGIFGYSLVKGTSMIERFARMKEKWLSPAQISYCRTVTAVWTTFFVLNAACILFVSLFGSIEAWLLVIGPTSYTLIGLLFLVEYIVRTIKFRKYDESFFFDRFLKKIAHVGE